MPERWPSPTLHRLTVCSSQTGMCPIPESSRARTHTSESVGFFLDVRSGQAVCSKQEVAEHVAETWLPWTSQISLVELFAPIVALFSLGNAVAGARIPTSVDSEAAEGALVRGYSARSDLCLLTGAFWALCTKLSIAPFIDRASTEANPADGPSRDCCEELVSRGAIELEGFLPDELLTPSSCVNAMEKQTV